MLSQPLFSVSQFTTWHNSFEEDVELYGRLGIEGIEICERKLSPNSREAHSQLEMVSRAGLRVTSVQPRCHALFPDSMCPDVLAVEDRVAIYRNTIDLFTAAFPGQNLPFVAITGNPHEGDFAHSLRTARRIYPELADFAAERGARIMFEPLNPVLMNRDTFICTLDGALQLIHDVNRPNFGLMLDVWHVWREPHIYERLGRLKDLIFGVHVSDWPAGEPRHIGDRLLPGDGVIDLPQLFSAIRGAGYNDAYCLEIFSVDHLPDSLWRRDPADVINCGKQGFLSAWNRQATS
jgi:sugar phosphate isomerase/epimerase